MNLFFAPLAVLSFMAACSPSSDRSEMPADSSATMPATLPMERARPESAVTATATRGGDGSAIELSVLDPEEIGEISGELGCSFTFRGSDTLLLVAKGYVGLPEANLGRVKIGDYVETVTSSETGYDSMVEGAEFNTRGMVIRITTGADVEGETNEAIVQNAELTAMRTDGAERSYQGEWTCGP